MRRRVGLLTCAVVALAAGAGAQDRPTLDTLQVAPPDTVEVAPTDTLQVAPPDTAEVLDPDLDRLRAAPRDFPVVAPPGPRAAQAMAPVPARAPVFSTAALLDPVPGLWRYDLGPPGAPHGMAFRATPPHRVALRLDGRPAEDIFTGRPALERLPDYVLGPLGLAPGLYGAAAGVDAHLRAFAADVPITELRYRAGPEAHQFIGVSHAQTRRPAFIERLGGERARLGVLFHVSGERASAGYDNSQIGGFEVLARVTAALPGIGLELSQRYRERDEGAWGGVDPAAPEPFWRGSPVRDAFGQRQMRQNDLALRALVAALPGAEPLEVRLFWIAATFRHAAAATASARGHRYGAALAQPLTLGGQRITVEAEALAGRVVEDAAFGGAGNVLPPEVHLTIGDTLRVDALRLGVRAGVHAAGGFVFPAGRLSLDGVAGPVEMGVGGFAGGARHAAVERLGFGEAVAASPIELEQVLGGEARMSVRLGPASIGLRGEVQRRTNPRSLAMADDLTATAVTLQESLTTLSGTLSIGLREDATRGLYASGWATLLRVLDAGTSDLHRREAAAVPELYAFGRLGGRARGLFGGNLDLDVFVRGRGWAAHRGRALHPATALLMLAPPGSPPVPARAVVDVVLEGGFGAGRATAFVAYQNALAGIAYPGVFVTPLYPLPDPRLRVGVFWILPN